MKRILFGVMLTLLLISMLTLKFNIQPVKAEPKTWTVDDDGPADFHTIQQAVNVANSGDTIYVYNGTYYGHIYIYKSLTIVGESKYGTIIDGGGVGTVVEIAFYSVTLYGFTIKNSSWSDYYMYGSLVYLENAQMCNISNNLFSNGRYGITAWFGQKNIISGNAVSNTNNGIILEKSSNNNVIGNTISDCIEYAGGPPYGIQLWWASNNNVEDNVIANISYTGIRLNAASTRYNYVKGNIISNCSDGITAYSGPSYYNTIVENRISDTTWGIAFFENSYNISIIGNSIKNSTYSGIHFNNPNNNEIIGNTLSDCYFGIYMQEGGPNNKIIDNNVTGSIEAIKIWDADGSVVRGNKVSNSGYGVTMWQSMGNIVEKNIATQNGMGILAFENSNNNVIKGNIISNNDYGIFLQTANYSQVFHNDFIDNTVQVYLSASYNTTLDYGYPSGGNYWSDYGGVDIYSGPSQNETGIDGIGDTAYVIDENNQDNYPLMNSWFLPWGNWSHYHSYMEIVRVLLYLNETYPNIVDVFSIGKSWQNQDIYCIRLTNEDITHPKPKLFFVGYHHARESISAELPLYFTVEAATNFGTNATITHMLNYSEIYIVPMLNVDAFEAFKQNEWQRKNVHPFDEDNDTLLDEDPPDDANGNGYIEDLIRWTGSEWVFVRWEGKDDDGDGLLNEDWVGGVDLNRNYGYQWNATCDSGSPYTWAEDYRGPAPFSEPETQAIRDLALSNNFKYAVSFHSGSEVIGYPWGYTYTPAPDDATFREIAGNLSQLTGASYGQNSGLYTASGMWDDWMYANRSTFALTCEIYTNNSAWQYEPGPEPNTLWEKGVFQFFNPDPNNIETVIQRWLPVFTYTTNRAITEAYDTATNNVTPLKTIVGQGYSVHINVTVSNRGDFTETFNVIVYANTPAIQTKVLTLTSGNSATITFTWNTTGFVKGNYTIRAYAWPVQGEADTGDNTKIGGTVFVTVAGDVTGEGLCDMQDISILVDKFLAEPGYPRWDVNCDVQDDLVIDMADISIAIDNFLKDP